MNLINSTKVFSPVVSIVYVLFATGVLFLLENVFHPVYLYLLLFKIFFFFLLPFSFAWFAKRETGRAGSLGKSSFILGVSFGIFSMFIIGGTYFLLKENLNWAVIHNSMESRHINKATFIAIFLYIMFGNSLLEEYFFRGIVHFQTAKLSKIGAYIFSAFLFSIYHMMIFSTWFQGWILALALFGLFAGGIFFSWLYERTGGIWSAWIFHIFADLAILIIGYKEFFL